MKKLILILIALLLYQIINAQTLILDKEKLLEFYQTQRYAEAAQYLQTIYPVETKDVKALSQIAYCYMMSGKFLDADKNYLKINELQPYTIPILFNLSNINSRLGNISAVKFYLLDIIKIDSLNFNAYRQLADITNSIKLKILY